MKSIHLLIAIQFIFFISTTVASDQKDQRQFWINLERASDASILIDGVQFDEKQLLVICELLRNSGREPSLISHYKVSPDETHEWLKSIAKKCSVQFTTLVGPKVENNAAKK